MQPPFWDNVKKKSVSNLSRLCGRQRASNVLEMLIERPNDVATHGDPLS